MANIDWAVQVKGEGCGNVAFSTHSINLAIIFLKPIKTAKIYRIV
jgi:hypothetical protein